LVFQLTGELARASELIAEQDAITQATGAPPFPNSRLGLAAWRGRQQETSDLIATTLAEATVRGEGLVVSSTELSCAYLHNGLGSYGGVLGAASSLVGLDGLAHSSLVRPERVEAAVRAGTPERAAAALERLTSRARASGTQWALGMAARSRALTST